MENFEKYVGQIFDNRYKLIRIVGVGGMAVVFEAHDLLMKRTVAIKMLKDDISGDTQAVKRFINESKAVAMLSHPNIVNIFDVSVKDNLKYIVMEYIEGITLKNYMTRRGTLSFREVVSYSEQILRALEHAHSKGIVHRDIKPQNIMLLKNGLIKVTDFGIAKLPNSETLTMTDKTIGTVHYISPEQASGRETSQASDLYSLGVLMYEMSTGKLPFNADSPISVALMHVNKEPARPRSINPEIPRGLEQIILTAMEKKTELRYQSASQMLKQITKLKENPNIVFKKTTDKKAAPVKKAEKKKKPKKEKVYDNTPTSMGPIILGVMTAFFIALGVSAFIIVRALFMDSGDTSLTITVPNLLGETFVSEEALGLNMNHYRIHVEKIYDENQPENMIIEQKPTAGEQKKVIPGQHYCDLTITVSLGSEKILLGDYSVKNPRETENKLKNMGLKVAKDYVYHDTIPTGYVTGTYPAAGERVARGDTVIIYISQGEQIQTKSIPNLVGLNHIEAARRLREAGFEIGNVESVISEQPEGEVISHTPAADTSVAVGFRVDFVISAGGKAEDPDDPVEPKDPLYDPDDPDNPDNPDDPDDPDNPDDEKTDDEKFYEQWREVYLRFYAQDMTWEDFKAWAQSTILS